MKVKAKFAVKVDGKWRKTGEVFNVKSTDGLLEAVEVLEEAKKEEPEEVPAQEAEPAEEAKAEPEFRSATRNRKKASGK